MIVRDEQKIVRVVERVAIFSDGKAIPYNFEIVTRVGGEDACPRCTALAELEYQCAKTNT